MTKCINAGKKNYWIRLRLLDLDVLKFSYKFLSVS